MLEPVDARPTQRYTFTCAICGVEAPTCFISLHCNIGMILVRQTRSVETELCKNCLGWQFWDFQRVNLFFGWWGIISFFATFFNLFLNSLWYWKCRRLPPVPDGATIPDLAEQDFERIEPLSESLFQRLDQGEDYFQVVYETAAAAQLTPGQVALYIREFEDKHCWLP